MPKPGVWRTNCPTLRSGEQVASCEITGEVKGSGSSCTPALPGLLLTSNLYLVAASKTPGRGLLADGQP
jgi:hypothetical protein